MPSSKFSGQFHFSTPAIYRIHVQGILDLDWSKKLAGMQISNDEQNGTLLVGRLADQAALAGVLETLYNLHLPVLSVECVEKLKK